MERFSKILSLVLALSLAMPSGAAAEAALSVGIGAVYGAGPTEEKEILRSFENAFQSSGWKVITHENIRGKIKLENNSVEGVYKKAKVLLRKGIDHYKNSNLDKAIEELAKARALFRKSVAGAEDERGLLAVQLYLAMSYFGIGLVDKAEEELRTMVRLDPKREERVLKGKYPAEILKLYKRVRQEVINGPKGDVTIETIPTGAKVYFDGVFIGPAPVRLEEVPVDEHFIVVKSNSGSVWSGSKMVVSGSNIFRIKIDDKVKAANVYSAFKPLVDANEFSEERGAFLDDIALKKGIDVFLFLEKEGSLVRSQLYDVRNRQTSGIVEKVLSDKNYDKCAEESVSVLSKYINSSGYVSKTVRYEQPVYTQQKESTLPPSNSERDKEDVNTVQTEKRLDTSIGGDEYGEGGPLLGENPPGEEKSWYENPWVWGSAIGAVVLTGVILLFFSDVLKSDPSSGTITITPGGGTGG